MIRAQEVSAAIRFRSLLRGRIEIATLSASEPSINLVRNDEGRWNLASLLERNAQIPAAPTGKPASERRPAFPYLEASNARINFKLGQTKKSYALMDADVALWQDSENSWAARIKAEPVRTDFNLTDTGLVQINATWQRAQSSRLTPVQLTVQWRNGQLGQITQLLSGKDRGWRGGVNFTANVSGTPEALRIESQTADRRFPSLRHCWQRERAPGNRLLGKIQRVHEHARRSALRIAGQRRDAPPTGRFGASHTSAGLRSDAIGREGTADLCGAIAATGEEASARRPHGKRAAECGVPRHAQRTSRSRRTRDTVCCRNGPAAGSATNVRLSSNAGSRERMRLPLARFHWPWREQMGERLRQQPSRVIRRHKKRIRSPLNLTCGLGRSHWR